MDTKAILHQPRTISLTRRNAQAGSTPPVESTMLVDMPLLSLHCARERLVKEERLDARLDDGIKHERENDDHNEGDL